MAHSDKQILIVPNVGSETDDPKIVFSGADASTTAQNLTLKIIPANQGTLVLSGTAEILRVSDITGLSVTGAFSAGNGASTASLTVNGSDSGSGGGGQIIVKTNGVANTAIGNYSNLIGGAYDATSVIYSATSLKFFNNGSTHAVLSSIGGFNLVDSL